MSGRLNIDGRVSIVVQVYNGESEIMHCIERLSKQTHKDIEIIIVNDGSTDNTNDYIIKAIEYLEEADIPSRYTWTNGPSLYTPMGIQYPMLVGIGLSTGEYWVSCSVDDYFNDEYITMLLAAIGDKAAAYPASPLLRIDGEIMPDGFANHDFNDEMYKAIVIGDGRVPWVRGPMMVRKDAFYKIGADIVGQVCYEWLLQLKMWAVSDMVYVPEAIYYHTMGNSSHVDDGDSKRNQKLVENGYDPKEVFIGKYSYSNCTTLRGPDFRCYYNETRRRFPEAKDYPENPNVLLWDLWNPLVGDDV